MIQLKVHPAWEYCSNSIKTSKIDSLYQNREFMGTMFCESFVQQELEYLKQNYPLEWISEFTQETLPNLSNGNLIHQLYHITLFINYVGIRLLNEPITEFGAGYGGLCKVLHRLGFTSRYNIIELPNLQGLQQEYLQDIKNIQWYNNFNEFLQENDESGTLVALWSLSESPQEIRDYYLYESDFDQYFFAYGNEFYDMQNLQYFESFTEMKSQYFWQKITIPFMQNQYYLMGKRC